MFGALGLMAASCSKKDLNMNSGHPDNSRSLVTAGSPAGDVVGKVVTGYQAWFSAAGDGSPVNSWVHQDLEQWPDVREYTNTYAGSPFNQNGTAQPGFFGNLGNGQPAKMFSSFDQQVINTHFSWMQQNGIDCAALQIFGSYVNVGTPLKALHDAINLKVETAAETSGRKFYIMFDCNSDSPVEDYWTNTIVNTQHLTTSSAYAKQNGKPVVCLYGMGITTRGSAADWLAKINWFKAQGCYVIGSPPWGFSTNSTYISAYNACNMILPWSVGRQPGSTNFPAQYATDLAYCEAHGIDFQACIFPGYARFNTNTAKPKNEIPRMHGDFMWTQFAAARSSGVQNVYIAMFDEINEGTAIMKSAEDSSMIPSGKYFLTLDADGVHVSSDFYLRLVNNGGKMVKGQIPYQATHSTPFVVATPVANGTYKIINRNSGLALDAKGQLTANGTDIQQWTYSGGNNQRWTVTSLGSGTYKIIGVQSGRSLDVEGQSTANGAAVQLYDYTGAANQQWIIAATSGGYYTVKGLQSGKPMEVVGNTTTPGALIDIYDSNGGNHQQWAFQTP